MYVNFSSAKEVAGSRMLVSTTTGVLYVMANPMELGLVESACREFLQSAGRELLQSAGRKFLNVKIDATTHSSKMKDRSQFLIVGAVT